MRGGIFVNTHEQVRGKKFLPFWANMTSSTALIRSFYEAFFTAFGSWKVIDADAFIKDIAEQRKALTAHRLSYEVPG